MSVENKSLTRFVIEEVFNCKRKDLVEAFYSPDFEGYCPDGTLRGREGIHGLFENYQSAFPDFQLHVNYILAEGDRVVVHYTFVGTNTGSLAGFPPTGNTVRVPGVIVSRVENGWISEQSFVWDNLGPRRQNWLASIAERQMSAPVSR
jgi:steroid delta-isomerase-like uncharacterized protein